MNRTFLRFGGVIPTHLDLEAIIGFQARENANSTTSHPRYEVVLHTESAEFVVEVDADYSKVTQLMSAIRRALDRGGALVNVVHL